MNRHVLHFGAGLAKIAQFDWLPLVLVSVAATVLAFPSQSQDSLGAWSAIMFVGLVPLFIAVEMAKSWKQAVFRSFVWSFLCNLIVCSWVAPTVNHFANTPWIVGALALVGLSLFEQASWVVFFGLRHFLQKNLNLRPLLWSPCAILVLEVCAPRYFPSTLGNAFYKLKSVSQLADLTGVWGLTSLLVLTNEAVAISLIKSWPRRDRVKHGVVAGVLFCLALIYGNWRQSQIEQIMAGSKRKIKVAMIQPNVNSVMKVRAEFNKSAARREILNQMMRLTDKALEQNPAFVFWPEVAYPDTYHGESQTESFDVTETLDAFLLNRKLNLLFGARDQVGRDRFNSLIWASPETVRDEAKVLRYHKNLLLNFTENIPGSSLYPEIRGKIIENGGTAFTPGDGPQVFEVLGGLKLGAMICLEGLYARYARSLSRLGAQVFVNATNDGWFGVSREPSLHLYLTAFRSIENRIPLIRATNTGFTSVIDVDGSIRVKSDLSQEEVVIHDVPIYSPIATPYQFWGDALIILAGLYCLAAFVPIRMLKS